MTRSCIGTLRGRKTATWDGCNNRGDPLPAGINFYRMTAPGFDRTRKIALIR